MTGKPVTQNGMEQALLPDRIEQFGGGLFSCFMNDCALDCFTCCCPNCSYAQAVNDGGEGGVLTTCLCMTFLPCYWPLCTCGQVEAVNRKLGGQEMGFKRCCCQVLCAPCSACQFVRAVKNAKSKGMFKQGGAPQNEEMGR